MSGININEKLINNDSLFNYIRVIHQNFDIVPNDHKHYGAHIEYQDISELRSDFIEELVDTIVDWVYSSERFQKLVQEIQEKGKSLSATNSEVVRMAHNKFRGNRNSEQLLIQGQLGELLLFNFIQKCMQAVPLLRKMRITTSNKHERFGADAIHYKNENGKNIMILGEAKTYTSNYGFNKAFTEAIESILTTFNNIRTELKLFNHEDFLEEDLIQIAEDFLNNKLKNTQIHLVSIVVYNETKDLQLTNENDIKKQIEEIIKEKYRKFDNAKIDINSNIILKRITYIVFPIWDLEKLAEDFQKKI